jgi:hypothetical protein
MASEAEIIIAFLFKRSGKNELKKSEIYLPLSLELGWFSTKESQEFLNYAVKQKLLKKKGDLLAPSFDIENITVPVGFLPSKKIFTEEEKEVKAEKKNVIDAIIHCIAEKTNQNTKAVIKEIKKAESEKNILSEVAALFVAKGYNIDISDYLDGIEASIYKK